MGWDARETSVEFADAVSSGIMDAGGDVLDIGMSGTEEMYWGVTEFKADAGIIITASHNPINYNGMKIVKTASRPLDDEADFKVIKKLAEDEDWNASSNTGKRVYIAPEARIKYVSQVLKFVTIDRLKPLKIVVNCGNGAAGPTFDAIVRALLNENAPLK